MANATTHTEQITRLKKIEGQIRGVQRMIEDVEANILRKHLQGCVATAVRTGSEREQDAKLDEIIQLLFRFKA